MLILWGHFLLCLRGYQVQLNSALVCVVTMHMWWSRDVVHLLGAATRDWLDAPSSWSMRNTELWPAATHSRAHTVQWATVASPAIPGMSPWWSPKGGLAAAGLPAGCEVSSMKATLWGCCSLRYRASNEMVSYNVSWTIKWVCILGWRSVKKSYR